VLDTIILLTGPVEQGPLTAVLRGHHPRLNVVAVKSLDELEDVHHSVLARARLIGFVTPVIVPARILKNLGHGGYNFHPGSPHYPGWVPSHFAVYERAGYFGATAHMMIERVDAGPIVGVELFGIPSGTDVLRLQEMAFTHLAKLFWRLGPELVKRAPLPELPIQWTGAKSTKAMYAAMCEIPADVSKEELERRIEVFGNGHYGIDLTVRLHGHAFRYAPKKKIDAPGIVPAEKILEPA
jgi:methionyl-tRNA formyltransferase